MDGYGNMEMNLVVRPDKVDGIRTLFASMVMKKAAGIAEDWEWVIVHGMRFDKITGTLLYMDDPAEHTYISLNHEAWLTTLAPYLEDGFIEFAFLEYMGKHRYEIMDGKLYHVEEAFSPSFPIKLTFDCDEAMKRTIERFGE